MIETSNPYDPLHLNLQIIKGDLNLEVSIALCKQQNGEVSFLYLNPSNWVRIFNFLGLSSGKNNIQRLVFVFLRIQI